MIPHGNDWPPLAPVHEELTLQARSRVRRRGRQLPPAGDSSRGAGPVWWLELRGEDLTARRLPRRWPNRNPLDCQHDRGYALTLTFVVLPFIVCRHCGDRLDWPNHAIGRRAAAHNWQAVGVLGVLELGRRLWRPFVRLRYWLRRRRWLS